MKRTTVFSSGKSAFDLLSDPTFLQEWSDLYEGCSWGTVYQSRDFVKIWYETYREQFVPVILTMLDPKSRLCGILTLASNRSTGRLVYAGDVLSEYQVWLARNDAEEVFILEALELLGREFPRQVLRLKFLPPGTPVGPLQKTTWTRNTCFLTPSSRPLIGPSDEHRVDQSLKSKKVKLNRLKRLGTVSFKKVARDDFPEVLERAWPLFEFRQIEQFNSSPFFSDSQLKPFLLSLAKHSDVLHMTVLQVDEVIVAWLLGTQSNGFLHLVATGYSPFHARHSPAMLHMLMLAKSLFQEQRVFDLTPGGDKYKDQLATDYEKTYTLHFFPRLRAAIEDQQTRKLANKALKKIIRVAVRNPALALRTSFLGRRRDRQFLNSPSTNGPQISFRLHKVGRVQPEDQNERSDEVKKNKVIDLLHYEPTPGKTRRDFVNDAWRFIEQGADVYTLVRNAHLIASCWIVSGEKTASAEYARSGVPAETALLLGFYAHASADESKMLNRLLQKWAIDTASAAEIAELNIGVPETGIFQTIGVPDDGTHKIPLIALNKREGIAENRLEHPSVVSGGGDGAETVHCRSASTA